MSNERVLGVDACKGGWIGIALNAQGTSAYFAVNVDELVRQVEQDGPVAVVAIDMPIGLPDKGYREADVLARKEIGGLGSSVFMMPVRAALDANDHRKATAINRELAGRGVSIQAYGLRKRIKEVEWWTKQTKVRVVEIHPEVSFATLAGEPLAVRKHCWAGVERRRELLAAAGSVLTGDLEIAGSKAAVAAWTARRVLRGEARCLPSTPQRFSDGLECAIWT